MIASIFQWTVRTSQKVYNGLYTPYEIITGMKPRFVFDTIMNTDAYVKKIGHEEYVRELINYLKKVHQYISDKHTDVRDKYKELKARQYGSSYALQVGDFVLYKKGHFEEGVSDKNQRKWRNTIFQIIGVEGGRKNDARTYYLADAVTGEKDNLGFSQPVTQDRLTPVEILPLSRPVSEGRTCIQIDERTGQVGGQTIDGKITVKWDGENDFVIVDLSRENYKWLN